MIHSKKAKSTACKCNKVKVWSSALLMAAVYLQAVLSQYIQSKYEASPTWHGFVLLLHFNNITFRSHIQLNDSFFSSHYAINRATTIRRQLNRVHLHICMDVSQKFRRRYLKSCNQCLPQNISDIYCWCSNCLVEFLIAERLDL